MKKSDDRLRRLYSESLSVSESRAERNLDSPLHRQAADLLTARESLSLFRLHNSGGQPESLPDLQLTNGEGPRQLTESDCHQASRNENMLNGFDAEQVAQVVSTNPTSEAIVALAERDIERAVDMCLKRADIRSVAEHNDDLPPSFHRLLKVRQRGPEAG